VESVHIEHVIFAFCFWHLVWLGEPERPPARALNLRPWHCPYAMEAWMLAHILLSEPSNNPLQDIPSIISPAAFLRQQPAAQWDYLPLAMAHFKLSASH
jgi:hypothetical protein